MLTLTPKGNTNLKKNKEKKESQQGERRTENHWRSSHNA